MTSYELVNKSCKILPLKCLYKCLKEGLKLKFQVKTHICNVSTNYVIYDLKRVLNVPWLNSIGKEARASSGQAGDEARLKGLL
ncbi:hypothetical protein HanRHA438_Chr09g0396641 [Helianthus annuus]|nr:hypothetical protein HanRHA438_Chr09g0396641 [Helianthus annuus]